MHPTHTALLTYAGKRSALRAETHLGAPASLNIEHLIGAKNGAPALVVSRAQFRGLGKYLGVRPGSQGSYSRAKALRAEMDGWL